MNGDDHIEIQKITVLLDILCEKFDKFDAENRQDHKDIIAKLDSNIEKVYEGLDNKTDKGTFKWVVSGLATLIFFCLITIGGLSIDNKMELAKLNDLLTDHIGFAALVYKDVTGEEWGHHSRESILKAKEKVMEVRKEALEKKQKD